MKHGQSLLALALIIAAVVADTVLFARFESLGGAAQAITVWLFGGILSFLGTSFISGPGNLLVPRNVLIFLALSAYGVALILLYGATGRGWIMVAGFALPLVATLSKCFYEVFLLDKYKEGHSRTRTYFR